MTREEYLRILQSNLVNVPPEEVWNIMQYYREYFDDAGQENVQRVIAELGPPELLARKVSADFVKGNESGRTVQKKNDTWLVVVLLVLSAPVWGIALIVAASLLFAAVITIASLVFAFGVTAFALAGGGICTVGAGIGALFTHTPTGIMLIGAGLLCAGIGLLFMVLMCWLAVLLKTFITWIVKKVSERKKKREQRS